MCEYMRRIQSSLPEEFFLKHVFAPFAQPLYGCNGVFTSLRCQCKKVFMRNKCQFENRRNYLANYLCIGFVPGGDLYGPMLRDFATIVAMAHIARYFFRDVGAPPKLHDTHLGTYFHRGTFVRYPILQHIAG